jgi:hypothetical protein
MNHETKAALPSNRLGQLEREAHHLNLHREYRERQRWINQAEVEESPVWRVTGVPADEAKYLGETLTGQLYRDRDGMWEAWTTDSGWVESFFLSMAEMQADGYELSPAPVDTTGGA